MTGRAPRLVPVELEAAPEPHPAVPAAGPDAEEETTTVAELFRAHAGYIAGLGIRMLGRRDQAEDLLQDVFVEAVRVADRLRQPQQARRWLIVVAVRKARRRLRRQRLLRWLGHEDVQEVEARFAGEVKLDEISRRLIGRVLSFEEDVGAGAASSLGDVDGDGRRDVLVGGLRGDERHDHDTRVYIFLGEGD